MRVLCSAATLFVSGMVGLAGADEASNPSACWPQFRGPNACGVTLDGLPLPVEFGPDNAIWMTPLPPGHSSPCIWGERIFLTAFDRQSQRLETLCLARGDGKILWRQTAPAAATEKVHPLSTPANATPATDGQRVYSYFGSYGLICYDLAGQEVWRLPQSAPPTPYGSGSSPIVAGEFVVLSVESPPKPVLLAIDRCTGRIAWRHECLPYLPGYATPVIWHHAGTAEVILHSSVGVTALRLADGAEQWWVSLLSAASSTPTVGDGRLFVAACWPGGEPEDRVRLPEFDPILSRYDANRDGKIDKKELPADLLIVRRAESGDIPGAEIRLADVFPFFDADADEQYERAEWDKAVAFSEHGREHGLLAIRPGGRGEVTKSHTIWRESRSVSEVPSPLVYDGRVYMVKDGGIISCLDATSGRLQYRTRLGPRGAYFSSPVAGDGKIFAASHNGAIVVLAAGETFQRLAVNELHEPIFATPAIAAGRLYVRTESRLYAFRLTPAS
ncbi:MAG: PQQ-binding-like beta-propeller repeat protein [Pirellulaceae bacterium]|nr:PQQ-binding-like beta-propeller repeat protein [Pirellulaceae bacterium]